MRIDHADRQHRRQHLIKEILVAGMVRGGIQKKTLIQLMHRYHLLADYVEGRNSIPVRCDCDTEHIVQFINRHLIPKIAQCNRLAGRIEKKPYAQRKVIMQMAKYLEFYLDHHSVELKKRRVFRPQIQWWEKLFGVLRYAPR